MPSIVADLNGVVRTTTRLALKSLGHGEMVEARNGYELATSLCDPGVDLVIADCSLPSLSGRELVRTIRTANPDAKVILMSSSPDRETVIKMAEAGIHGWIVKPLVREKVVATVGKVLAADRVH